MSHPHEHEDEPAQDEDAQLEEEDVIEVVEDSGDEPMDDDEDDNRQYDGEIIIGAPMPGEEGYDGEDMPMDDEITHEDNSWGASSLHTSQQSIFALALHPAFPNPPLAVSGGEDDLGYIFCPLPPTASSSSLNSETYKPVKLTGHTDSVVSAGFSADGEMVATGGMDGKVRVWRRVKGRNGGAADEWKDWEFLTSMDTSSEIVVSPPPPSQA